MSHSSSGSTDPAVQPSGQEPQSQPTTEPAEPQVEPNGASDNGDAGEGDPAALGDAGKRALDAMKAKWQAERDRRKAFEARIAELEAKNAPKPEEGQPDVEAIKQSARSEALKAANERILRAEIKAAAAGKLADPSDALTMLDLSKFDVDSDGSVDPDEISEAIDKLLQNKPYLSAQGVKRFQGSADSGARQGKREGAQLTRAELKGMSPQAILQAQKEGRLTDLGYK
jgi:DNA-binding NarL/FixJ family response regulator